MFDLERTTMWTKTAMMDIFVIVDKGYMAMLDKFVDLENTAMWGNTATWDTVVILETDCNVGK